LPFLTNEKMAFWHQNPLDPNHHNKHSLFRMAKNWQNLGFVSFDDVSLLDERKMTFWRQNPLGLSIIHVNATDRQTVA